MFPRIVKGLVVAGTSLALLGSLVGLSGPAAFAQADRGSIVGTVRDASGAVVPKATITVTNTVTDVISTMTTNGAGEYQVLALLPGTYSVKASASGFETQVQDNVAIDVQTRQQVNFALKVGSVQQEVMVTASEPQLQTQTADIGGVVHEQQIVDLPLNGRRYADLALLEPGVQKYYNAANPSPDRFSVNGNLELQNDFLLDGIDNNSNSENLQEFSVQVVQPPPDALQEFRIQTRTYSAEFGTSAGAVVNASIKTGTNGFHGDLWEFIRNDNLDANDFFSNATGTPIGHYTQNQFGGTVGGPIRKDKTFFFFDYQRFTARRAQTIQSTIPTPLMLTGNFTELPFALQNPSIPGQTSCISGNIVNPACQDPVAQKLLAQYPSPNIASAVAVQGQPGSFALGAPNYIFQAATPNDTYSLDGRVDDNVNNRNRLFGRYSFNHVSRQDPSWTSNHVVGDGNFATQYRIKTQQVAIGLTTTLSNAMVNEIRGGWNRDFAHSDPLGVTLGTSLAPNFGLNGIPVGPNTSGLPPIYVGGLNPVRLGGSPWRPQFQIAQVYQLVDNLSWLKGTHSFKFGYEYHKWADNFLDIRSLQGEFGSLFGQYTDPTGQGFAVADFLLGDQDFGRFTTPLVVHNYQPGHSFYGQDSWRATSKLTLTYGLRWEIFSPVLNRQNETSNFSPASGGSLVTAPSSASGWSARALINPDFTSFAPRFGFAYHALDRVVIRGGFGVFFQHENRIGSESILQLNPPFLRDSQTVTFGGPITVFQLKNGFPLNSFTGGPLDLAGIQFRAQDPNQRNPYVEQVSFGPEVELSRDTVLDLTYVGNWARKANRLRNGNEGIITGVDGFGCPIVNFPFPNLNDQNTVVDTGSATGCSLPGGHGFLEYATNDGNTNYNALELSLRHAYTGGLSYGVSYTWSHGLANYVDNLTGGAFPANGYDYSLESGNSQIDIRHRFVANAVWQLPFGNGRRWLNQGGVAGKLAGGWQANSIVTLQTGTPFNVGAPDLSFTDGSGNDAGRPNCVGNPFAGATSTATGPNGYVGTGSGFFLNPSAFVLQSPGTFGTCAPRAFYGPGLQDVDFSIFRNFRITEGTRLEFRTEIFNAFNHPNFADPSPSVGNPSSFKVFGLLNPILGLGSGGPGDPREIQFALKFYF